MSSWSCNESVCASCHYWCGRRKLDSKNDFFEALDENGICKGPTGSFKGQEVHEGSACSDWEPFRDLIEKR